MLSPKNELKIYFYRNINSQMDATVVRAIQNNDINAIKSYIEPMIVYVESSKKEFGSEWRMMDTFELELDLAILRDRKEIVEILLKLKSVNNGDLFVG